MPPTHEPSAVMVEASGPPSASNNGFASSQEMGIEGIVGSAQPVPAGRAPTVTTLLHHHHHHHSKRCTPRSRATTPRTDSINVTCFCQRQAETVTGGWVPGCQWVAFTEEHRAALNTRRRAPGTLRVHWALHKAVVLWVAVDDDAHRATTLGVVHLVASEYLSVATLQHGTRAIMSRGTLARERCASSRVLSRTSTMCPDTSMPLASSAW